MPKKRIIKSAPTVTTDLITKSVFDTEPQKFGYKKETVANPQTQRKYQLVPLPYGEKYHKFAEYYQMNTYMASCVDIISEYATMDYSIDTIKNEKYKETDKKTVETFFDNAGKFMPFVELLQATVMDWKCNGNGMQELVLTRENTPQTIYKHDSSSVLIRRDKLMYAIKRGTQYVYVLPWYIDPNDEYEGYDMTYDEYFRKNNDPHYLSKDFKPQSRIIHFRSPHPNDEFYGHPPAETCLRAIIGYAESGDYNIMWFENQGFGDWAVIITPDAPDNIEIEWDETELFEFENKIKSFFMAAGNRGPGRVMFIRAPNQYVKAEMKKLNTEVKEGHFRLYRRDARDEIIQRYRVPGVLIGVAESGGLTGQWREQIEVFKDTVISPLQTKIEWTYYNILKKYFGLHQFEFTLRRIDADTEKDKIEALNNRSNMFVGTPRDIANELNIDIPKTAKWADMPVAALKILLNPQTAEELGFELEYDDETAKLFEDLQRRLDAEILKRENGNEPGNEQKKEPVNEPVNEE